MTADDLRRAEEILQTADMDLYALWVVATGAAPAEDPSSATALSEAHAYAHGDETTRELHNLLYRIGKVRERLEREIAAR